MFPSDFFEVIPAAYGLVEYVPEIFPLAFIASKDPTRATDTSFFFSHRSTLSMVLTVRILQCRFRPFEPSPLPLFSCPVRTLFFPCVAGNARKPFLKFLYSLTHNHLPLHLPLSSFCGVSLLPHHLRVRSDIFLASRCPSCRDREYGYTAWYFGFAASFHLLLVMILSFVGRLGLKRHEFPLLLARDCLLESPTPL